MKPKTRSIDVLFQQAKSSLLHWPDYWKQLTTITMLIIAHTTFGATSSMIGYFMSLLLVAGTIACAYQLCRFSAIPFVLGSLTAVSLCFVQAWGWVAFSGMLAYLSGCALLCWPLKGNSSFSAKRKING